MILRDYQTAAIEGFKKTWEGERSHLVVAPTGAGKTVIFTNVVKSLIEDGARVLVLAHRNELISQAAKTMREAGIKVGVEKGSQKTSASTMCVVSSMQTFAGVRRQSFARDAFTHIVIDEAHHITAKSYVDILEHFEGAKVGGVTATPKASTIESFDQHRIIERKRLEDDGHLAKPRVKKIDLSIDLKGAKLSADKTRIADSEAGERIEPHLRKLVRLIPEMVGDQPGVVFLPLVATSELFRDIAAEEGIRVEHVSGKMKQADREAAYYRVRSGESQILSNANLLTEGFDLPALRWVCVLRPVLSPVYYEQAVGRAARIAPGKTHFDILDPLVLSEKHVLGALDFLGATEEEQEAIDVEGRVLDADELRELIEMSRDEIEQKREENRLAREKKIADKLQNQRVAARRISKPIDAARKRHGDEDSGPVSAKSRALLNKLKLPFAGKFLGWDAIETEAQAKRIVGVFFARSKAGLASVGKVAALAKQVREGIEAGSIDGPAARREWARSDVHLMNEQDLASFRSSLLELVPNREEFIPEDRRECG